MRIESKAIVTSEFRTDKRTYWRAVDLQNGGQISFSTDLSVSLPSLMPIALTFEAKGAGGQKGYFLTAEKVKYEVLGSVPGSSVEAGATKGK